MVKARSTALLAAACAAIAGYYAHDSGSANAADARASKEIGSWKDLPVNSYIDKGKEIRYCESQTVNKSKISIIIMPIGKPFEIRPVLNPITCPTSETAEKEGALVSINAGYFNLHGGSSTGASTGYITINGQLVCTPKDNDALVNNPKLKPYLEKIFDRSELRFIADSKGKVMVKIQPHSEAIPQGFTLQHALQAGPRLLPNVTALDEAFLRKEHDGTLTDSIGCMKPAARTAFGITRDDRAIIVCVAGPKQDEFSSGMTLQQLADYMKRLGCIEAINFDGGTSTTMAIRRSSVNKSSIDKSLTDKSSADKSSMNKNADEESASPAQAGTKEKNYSIVCGRVPETNVKSCLIIRRMQ